MAKWHSVDIKVKVIFAGGGQVVVDVVTRERKSFVLFRVLRNNNSFVHYPTSCLAVVLSQNDFVCDETWDIGERRGCYILHFSLKL